MQSEELKKVNLKVSNTSYSFTKMFGTEVGWVDGTPQDPCSGDSGGPLMLKSSGRWIIIGSLEFKCKKIYIYGISQKGLKITNYQGPSKERDMLAVKVKIVPGKGPMKEFGIR